MTHYEHHEIPDFHMLQVIEIVDGGPESERAYDIETATRQDGGFPSHWGEAPDGRWSEERAAWIRAHVETDLVEKRRTSGGSARAALALARALELS